MRVNTKTQIRLAKSEVSDFVLKGLQGSARAESFRPWTCAQTTARPEGAEDIFNRRIRLAKTAYPSHRLYRALWGGALFYRHLGLKPQAESSSPFGTKIPQPRFKESAHQILVRKSC